MYSMEVDLGKVEAKGVSSSGINVKVLSYSHGPNFSTISLETGSI